MKNLVLLGALALCASGISLMLAPAMLERWLRQKQSQHGGIDFHLPRWLDKAGLALVALSLLLALTRL
jgi:Spy/CpxP family protein refolding chaperone